MSVWSYGRVVRRSVTLTDRTAAFVFSTTRRPVGSDVEPPNEMGHTTIEHSEPLGVVLSTWEATGEVSDGVELYDVERFAAGTPDPQNRAREIGKGAVTSETAVRKAADGNGGEVVEHRFRVVVAFDKTRPFDQTVAGWLMRSKTFSLALCHAQVSFDFMARPEKPERRPKKAEAHLSLVPPADPDDGTVVSLMTTNRLLGIASGDAGTWSAAFLAEVVAELDRRQPAEEASDVR